MTAANNILDTKVFTARNPPVGYDVVTENMLTVPATGGKVFTFLLSGEKLSWVNLNLWLYDPKSATWFELVIEKTIFSGVPYQVLLPAESQVYVQINRASSTLPTRLVCIPLNSQLIGLSVNPSLTSYSTAEENGRIVSTHPCRLKTFGARNGTSATAYIQLYDLASAPAPGAVPSMVPLALTTGTQRQLDLSRVFHNGLAVYASSTMNIYTPFTAGDANKCCFEAEYLLDVG